MKTRAAVAFEAGKPLEIVEVDLEGPRQGEVLVEIRATGVCHTDAFTLSGDDPEGAFPAILSATRRRTADVCTAANARGGQPWPRIPTNRTQQWPIGPIFAVRCPWPGDGPISTTRRWPRSAGPPRMP